MALELTQDDREYLVRLLRRRHAELLHELHHASSRAFKNELRAELARAERLGAVLEPAVA